MSVMTAGEQRRRAGAARGRRIAATVPGQSNVMAGPWPGAGERYRTVRGTPGQAGRSAAAVVARPRTPADAARPRTAAEARLHISGDAAPPPTPAQRVTPAGRSLPTAHPARARAVRRAESDQLVPGGVAPARSVAGRTAPSRTRVRLTRRGRVVVAVLITAGIVLVTALAWLAGASRADAAGNGVPSSAVYHSLRSVVVLPGQSLWSIASKYEPGSDPQGVIQQIIDLNALGSTSVQPGQHLWLPRG